MTALTLSPERAAYAAYEEARSQRDRAFEIYRALPLTLAPFGLAAYQLRAQATDAARQEWLALESQRKVLQ